MHDWAIPLGLLGSYIGAAFLRMVYGFLDSGEAFNLRKFAASAIMTLFVSLSGALAMVQSDLIVNTAGLISLCVTAALAGWGTVLATRDITSLSQTQSKAKETTTIQVPKEVEHEVG